MNQATTLWQEMAGNIPQSMLGGPMGQGFAETWMKAFQQFQNMDLGQGAASAAAPPLEFPQLTFAPEALLKLQQD